MSNKNKPAPIVATMPEVKEPEEIKVHKAYFTHDIPIYLNYMNKVDTEHYELTIKGFFLLIKDKNKGYTHLVPLASVSTIEAHDKP